MFSVPVSFNILFVTYVFSKVFDLWEIERLIIRHTGRQTP
jgi:hypothetical protein